MDSDELRSPDPQDWTDEGQLRAEVWGELAPGFRTRRDLVEYVLEYDETLDAATVHDLVAELWQLRTRQLQVLPLRTPTDDQRLDAAFEALRADRILAEMNIGFDSSEAQDELSAQGYANEARGWVFFHAQDSSDLVSQRSVLIGFDAPFRISRSRFGRTRRERDDPARLDIGRRLVAALEQQDLRVRWDGSVDRRVEVVDLDWRRPLPDNTD